MEYYCHNGRFYASLLENLPLQHTERPVPGTPIDVLVSHDPVFSRASFCISDARQFTARQEDISWLDPARMEVPPLSLPRRTQRLIDIRSLRALNIRHPRWAEAAQISNLTSSKKRVHLLAVGDVGGTLLTGLKLLGGDCVSTIGICDLNEATVARWTAEMSQVSWPWDYGALPDVEPVGPAHLFDCDVFVFAAAKAVPAVGSGVQDVRMAQFDANRPLVEHYARQARAAGFRGLFAVMSDPVDPLCKAAYLASNAGADNQWDGQGLLAEQIQGFGLGVMNARAAAIAQQEPRFSSFLSEGRSFGPHGEGLLIANSIEHYDDALSRELTELVKTANLRIRALGFKPYVAPALSSGAMQLLLTLRGQWHCSSVCLGRVWFGVRNRFTASGVETETRALPDALFARLRETEQLLSAII